MEKINVIVLGTGRVTKEFIVKNHNSNLISIVGLVLDQAVCAEERELFVKDLQESLNENIIIMPFLEESFDKADIIFLPEYRRIVPDEFTSKYLMVNCHGGILPKWRGFSANAWAIMNGESEIGYSIHRVSFELDGGEVYFVKHIPIQDSQTYSDVHGLMTASISNEVPQVLYDIVRNSKTGESQLNAGVAYCTKFNAKMGELSDFNMESSYYVNLYRCMAKPLGTGLFMYYKGIKYSIGKVEHGRKYNSIDYYAIPGKIVNVTEEKIWVKTRDNVIVLSGVELCDGNMEMPIYKIFKNGTNIG